MRWKIGGELTVAVLIASVGVCLFVAFSSRERRRAEVRRLVFEAVNQAPPIEDKAWSRLREMGNANNRGRKYF